jgi:hypothetical protein
MAEPFNKYEYTASTDCHHLIIVVIRNRPSTGCNDPDFNSMNRMKSDMRVSIVNNIDTTSQEPELCHGLLHLLPEGLVVSLLLPQSRVECKGGFHKGCDFRSTILAMVFVPEQGVFPDWRVFLGGPQARAEPVLGDVDLDDRHPALAVGMHSIKVTT